MLFTELRFVLFFALVLGVHWALRSHRARKLWLLLASYAFYAGWSWKFLGLILLSTAIDFAVGLCLAREEAPRRRRAWLVLSLVANLGLLGFFKYSNFFLESAADFLAFLGLPASPATLAIILPVGISFYTFQSLSYTVDVYRRQLVPIASFTDFALFVAFFPQLVAGPIVRAEQFLPQLAEPRRFAAVDVRACLWLFLVGYVKKACVADHAAFVVDAVFAAPDTFGLAEHWLALALYAIQIYCDFSGYSDMAIATAGLLGYRLTLNFDFPYLARSVTEFWRRWHISLSTWFRDYLYIPLGGNRGTKVSTGRNLVLVFFLCGLWHGASWNFVVWGLFHGFFLVLERATPALRGRMPAAVGHAYTLLVVLLAWVFFRAVDLGTALDYLAGLAGLRSTTGAGVLAPEWWLLVLGFAISHVAMRTRVPDRAFAALPAPAAAVVLGVAAALALPFAAQSYQPFIYFQF